MRSGSLALVAALAVAVLGAEARAADADRETTRLTRVQDLHYGDVLFHFYQDENFEALTRLLAYTHWDQLPHHLAEADLLAGGMYLSLGMHNEAGDRFERLLTPDVPAGVRNRAWFYLAKIWYARGYGDRAQAALASISGTLPPDLEAEKIHLLSNILIREQRYDEAIALLDRFQGSSDWVAFAKYNLGVALVRKGDLAQADRYLVAVGELNSTRPELLALRDKANLALGFAYLQADQPANARVLLERVRLSGPYSNKALLGAGWASAELGNFEQALVPWLELRDRNLLDAAVQESYLAVPYAYGRLGANAQAADYYELAMRSFDSETASLNRAIANLRAGRMLDELLAQETSGQQGWFWQLKNLPDAPQSRYLYTVLAGNDFQEGLKNYRDLAFMSGRLDLWSDSMVAFDDMVETREKAYSERLPAADALLATDVPARMEQQRGELVSRLDTIERTGDAAALGTDEERDQWARIQAIERVLASGDTGLSPEELAAMQDRLRLVKGVLTWRLDDAMRARVYQERRDLKDLDAALREAQRRWLRVERARKNAPDYTGKFESRIAALGARLGELQQRLATTRDLQNDFLEEVAVDELEAQQERLAAYRVQARFALATIYDRAANAPAPGAAARPQPAPQTESEPPP
jgi:hypothetical protein